MIDKIQRRPFYLIKGNKVILTAESDFDCLEKLQALVTNAQEALKNGEYRIAQAL